MAVHCKKHGAQKSIQVCLHIKDAAEKTGRMPQFRKVSLDTENMGKFFTEVLFCEKCISKYRLPTVGAISFCSLIGEGERQHFLGLKTLRKFCVTCLAETLDRDRRAAF